MPYLIPCSIVVSAEYMYGIKSGNEALNACVMKRFLPLTEVVAICSMNRTIDEFKTTAAKGPWMK